MIGLYTSYVTPIFLRITSGRKKFVPGPFTLGRWYFATGVVAVAWVTFIVILLLFPSGNAVVAETMSESPHDSMVSSSLISSRYRLRGGHCDDGLHIRLRLLGHIGT